MILGGGLVGTECAIYLDGLGKDVTVLEMKDDWAADAYFMHRNAMKIYIDGSRIQIRTRTTAKAITEQGVLCAGPDGEVLVEADTILLAAGMKPDRAAVDAFYNTAPRVFQVGDCIQTGLRGRCGRNGIFHRTGYLSQTERYRRDIMKIKAAVTHEKGAPFVIEEVELAPPQKHEILVKIVACGVCHTDEAVQQQFIPVPLPAVLGLRAAASWRPSARR